jgi:6-hydroxycyclohex-1-ene-1-carbonyl-CoA dehydrogenase
MRIDAWMVRAPREPMVRDVLEASPGPREVAVRVAGCGVCHTDLGFWEGEVSTRHPLPLTLGHEVSGTVIEAGAEACGWLGRAVVVPAVIPCGACAACGAGQGRICPEQVFPGSDVHGGFASHVVVPAAGLCAVPDLTDPTVNPGRLELPLLAVVADAVSTPYQAIRLSGLEPGDLAVFVGVGGVGGFGVQIAAALGAHVVAIDVDDARLDLVSAHGAALALRSDRMEPKELRQVVRRFADGHGIPSWRHRIFETSGTQGGQATAFGLLGRGSHLAVVGFTPRKTELRLANLMALDASARGNWGCLPELYPAIVDLVLSGRIALGPFVEQRPLSSINRTFEDVHARRTNRRVILVPES